MKKTFFLIAFLFTISVFGQNKNQIASCCEGRKCTGSSNCTACTNCSGCKHCAQNGGTCGICSGGYKSTKSEPSKSSYSSKNSSNKSYSSSNKKISYSTEQELSVITSTLNLRKAPNTNSEIVEKLMYGDRLEFIEESGDWIYVKVLKSGNNGYVYAKYIN